MKFKTKTYPMKNRFKSAYTVVVVWVVIYSAVTSYNNLVTNISIETPCTIFEFWLIIELNKMYDLYSLIYNLDLTNNHIVIWPNTIWMRESVPDYLLHWLSMEEIAIVRLIGSSIQVLGIGIVIICNRSDHFCNQWFCLQLVKFMGSVWYTWCYPLCIHE